MPRKLPKSSEFEEMRSVGIGLASKLVIEQKYDLAKDVFTKLLNLRPDDVEVMALQANILFHKDVKMPKGKMAVQLAMV